MALYPNKLLPLDLASMEGGEPCDKCVQVLMSPSESEIEFNMAPSELACLVKPVDSEIVAETEAIDSPVLPTAQEREKSKTKLAEKIRDVSQTPPRTTPVKSRKPSPTSHKKEIKPPRKQDTGVSPIKDKAPQDEDALDDQPIQEGIDKSDIELKKYLSSHSARKRWALIQQSLHIVAGWAPPKEPLYTVLPTEADLAGLILESMFQRNHEKKELAFVLPDDVNEQRSQIEEDTNETTAEDVDELNIPEFLLEKPTDGTAPTDRARRTVEITLAVEQHKTIKIVHSRSKPVIKSVLKTQLIPKQVTRETAKTKGIHSPKDASRMEESENKEPTDLPAKTTDESENTNILQGSPVRTQPKSESISLSAKTKGKSGRKGYTSARFETADESENIETPSLPVKAKHESDSTLLSAKKKGKSDRKMTTTKAMEEREKPVLPVKGKDRSESTPLPVRRKSKSSKKTSLASPVKTIDERENIDSILARFKASYKSDKIQITRSSADSTEEPEFAGFADFKTRTIEEMTQGIIQKSPSHRQILKIVSPRLESDNKRTEGKVLLREKMMIYQKSEVTGSTRADLTDTSATSLAETDVIGSPSSQSTTSDFGEPEDILFFEDSSEQPIVRTRVFTKKPLASEKLPPIKGLRKAAKEDRKGTTFKRKMSKTMKEQFNQRKPLSPELLVRDVKELDLEQALVVTSTATPQDSHLKSWKDILKPAAESGSKCLKATAVDPKQAIDIYLQTKGINQLLQYLTTRLIMEEPAEPLDFLIDIMRNISYKRQFFYQMYKACKG